MHSKAVKEYQLMLLCYNRLQIDWSIVWRHRILQELRLLQGPPPYDSRAGVWYALWKRNRHRLAQQVHPRSETRTAVLLTGSFEEAVHRRAPWYFSSYVFGCLSSWLIWEFWMLDLARMVAQSCFSALPCYARVNVIRTTTDEMVKKFRCSGFVLKKGASFSQYFATKS